MTIFGYRKRTNVIFEGLRYAVYGDYCGSISTCRYYGYGNRITVVINGRCKLDLSIRRRFGRYAKLVLFKLARYRSILIERKLILAVYHQTCYVLTVYGKSFEFVSAIRRCGNGYFFTPFVCAFSC